MSNQSCDFVGVDLKLKRMDFQSILSMIVHIASNVTAVRHRLLDSTQPGREFIQSSIKGRTATPSISLAELNALFLLVTCLSDPVAQRKL